MKYLVFIFVISFFLLNIFYAKDNLVCETALNGYDACFKLGAFKPQVIFLDLFMPHMDGIEFLKQVRRNELVKDAKIFVITGNVESNLADQMQELGVEVVIEKPVDIEKLLEMIEKD